MPLKTLGKYAFWVLSRSGLWIYSRLPIFGRLRVALGVIQNQNTILVIERSDGRGISFPGGIALPWEKTEVTVVREILEETGLRVTRSTLKLRYSSSQEIPVDVSVFAVEAEGQLRESWEGTPCWLPLHDFESRLLPSQKRVLETIRQAKSGAADGI